MTRRLLLPLGFRFVPDEKDLVHFYLQRKLNGEDLPAGVVPECEIYGEKNPWEIFDKNLKKNYYVFTELKKNKNSKTRIERKAGCGTWKGRQTNAVKDPETKQILWFKKDFVFEVSKESTKPASGDNNGHWIMTEYSLPDPDGRSISRDVLCRICNTEAKDSDEKQEATFVLQNLTANGYSDKAIVPYPQNQCTTTEFQMSKMRTSSPGDCIEVSNAGKDFDQLLHFPLSNLIADEHGPPVSSEDQHYVACDSDSTRAMNTTILPPPNACSTSSFSDDIETFQVPNRQLAMQQIFPSSPFCPTFQINQNWNHKVR